MAKVSDKLHPMPGSVTRIPEARIIGERTHERTMAEIDRIIDAFERLLLRLEADGGGPNRCSGGA